MGDEDPYRHAVDEVIPVWFPRGGPIFVPDLVSPYIKVPVFQSQVLHELECIKAELDSDFLDLEEDISVDELKIVSEEDLVAEGIRIVFEGDDTPGTSSDVMENLCGSGNEDNQGLLDPDPSVSCEFPSGSESSDANAKKRKGSAKNIPKSSNKRKSRMTAPKKDKHVDDSYLEKVEHLKKIGEKQKEDRKYVELHSFKDIEKDKAAVASGKVETLKCLESSTWPIEVRCPRNIKNIPIQYPEVVLCVEIYPRELSRLKAQEYLVLGCQTLTELRDRIRCVTDVAVQKAVELEKENNYPAVMNDPSGYFLIEGLFCNDMRDPNAIDYSEPILDWLEKSKEEAQAKWNQITAGVSKAHKKYLDKKPLSEVPKFRAAAMDRTRFCDLGFRLGAGYLYCHQGDCKHLIVIRDMRLLHPDDVQNRAAYPLFVHQRKKVLKKCYVCNISKAVKVTLDNKLARENPCYFCDTCYFLLHYSKDGQLLYSNFKVFEIVEDYY